MFLHESLGERSVTGQGGERGGKREGGREREDRGGGEEHPYLSSSLMSNGSSHNAPGFSQLFYVSPFVPHVVTRPLN